MKEQCSEHPADEIEECVTKPPIGFTSNREHTASITYPTETVTAKGYGYGASTVSQAEADSIALSRAITHANVALNLKIYSSPQESLS